MNPAVRARWRELAPLLDRVLDLDPDDREDFIARAAGDDELRELLRGLLAQSESQGILDADSGRFAGALLDADAPAPPPRTHAGPYRLVRLLGEGGSGSVHLAERAADGYTQRVALKLLRNGVHDPAERERFRRERRVLARLEHPDIARLLDGGFTDDGVPWFALEYVEGESLIAACDARHLDVDARLRLLEDVCAAVAHAHRALVVHRDLKPANILVDAHGRPRLLDFGIAKLLDDGDDTEQTRTGLRRLTPGYAAPEQFDGGAITTATDVYALGVLLVELLTGTRPPRSTPEGPPRLAMPADRATQIADARATTPAALERRLRGDLATIAATALAHDPARRYASVAALGEDLARCRTRRPILARRASIGYRLARFARRQPAVVALSALLVASLVAGIAATWREAHRAREAAARATLEATRADAVRDFVLALFAGVTPDESRGRDIGARELLERGETRMSETLASQPELEAELSAVLAGAWRQLGALDRAEALASHADGEATSPAARHAATLELGAVREAQGQAEAAEAALRTALANATDARGAHDARVRLAGVIADRGRPDEAFALLDEALAADQADAKRLQRDLAVLGTVRFRAGDLPGAEAALRDAHAKALAAYGAQHTTSARAAHDLAVVLLQRGATADAATLLEKAVATRVSLLGARHPDVAQSRFNLAVARQRLGEADTARAMFMDALALQRELLGGRHPDVASTLNSIAALDVQQGRLDDAITRFGEAVAVARAAHGEQHPTVATMLGNLASLERMTGRLDAAERNQRAALAATEASLGERHYLAGVARLGLAGVFVEQARDAEALDEQRRALEVLEAALGADHADTRLARAALADSLLHAGDLDASRTLLGKPAFPDDAASLSPRDARAHLVAARLDARAATCGDATTRLPAITAALARGGAGLRADQAAAELVLADCLARDGDREASTAARLRASELAASLPYVPRRLRAALDTSIAKPR